MPRQSQERGCKCLSPETCLCTPAYLVTCLSSLQTLSTCVRAGFLCGGESNRFPVPTALLCHAQHHAGRGTALFCLGHRAYGQGETSASCLSSLSRRDWHIWEDADQGRTTRGGWRGCIVAQRGEEALGREALNWERARAAQPEPCSDNSFPSYFSTRQGALILGCAKHPEVSWHQKRSDSAWDFVNKFQIYSLVGLSWDIR